MLPRRRFRTPAARLALGRKEEGAVISTASVGALLLGAVIGYLTHYLVRRDAQPGIKDLTGIIGAVLGGVVLNVLASPAETSWYLIGLGGGFFLYWAALLAGREAIKSPVASRGLPLFPFLK